MPLFLFFFLNWTFCCIFYAFRTYFFISDIRFIDNNLLTPLVFSFKVFIFVSTNEDLRENREKQFICTYTSAIICVNPFCLYKHAIEFAKRFGGICGRDIRKDATLPHIFLFVLAKIDSPSGVCYPFVYQIKNVLVLTQPIYDYSIAIAFSSCRRVYGTSSPRVYFSRQFVILMNFV